MSLRINTNIEAIDTLRNLTISQNMFDQAMQQLSSGKRINSAADDAAGYAISQKLLGQSNGLNQASANAQNGISLVQTASGGLQTIQSMLQTMRQLAVQSANDTNTASDRSALQAEADQLSQEISQIATTTQFNTKNLLDGSFGATTTIENTGTTNVSNSAQFTTTGLTAGDEYTLAVTTAATQATAGAQGASGGTVSASTYLGANSNTNIEQNTSTPTYGVTAGTYTLTVAGSSGSANISVTAGATSGDTLQTVMDKINAVSSQTGVSASLGAGNTGLKLTSTTYGSAGVASASGANTLLIGLGLEVAGAAAPAGGSTGSANTTAGADASGITLTNVTTGVATTTGFSAVGNDIKNAALGFEANLNLASNLSGVFTAGTVRFADAGTGASLQVGANAGQNLTVSIGNMQAQALGVQGASSTQALDISSSATAASNAITTIDTAIQTVSAQAATLGAVQNRLQSAISNLAIGSENMQSAYSAITDVNMAQETTALASAQILQQAGISMLAQANQAPQDVLKLLG